LCQVSKKKQQILQKSLVGKGRQVEAEGRQGIIKQISCANCHEKEEAANFD
jgi:hypothetical protein